MSRVVLRYFLANAGVYLATAAVGALFSAVVAYVFTDYGTVPGAPISAVIGGAMFLMAALVALGLPIAIAVTALVGWIAARRAISRGALVVVALIAGLLWVGISFG